MSRLEQLFKDIQQDLKLYLFILGLFSLFRVGFIVVLNSYMNEATTLKDILIALYYGLKISLKSTGILIVITLVLSTVLNLIFKKECFSRLRLILGSIYVSLLTFLFYARIPYYKQFHMGFNQLLFNTFNDDVVALFWTLVKEYNLPVKLLIIAATSWLLIKCLKKWLHTKTYHLPHFNKWYLNIAFRVVILILIYNLTLFTRYGGTTNYIDELDWENSGVTKDEFLNEAILDDVHSLYRAYILHERVLSSTGLNMDPAKMVEYGNYIAGTQLDSKNLDDFLKKQAQGPKIDKPKHVFLIIGESYANWPLLDKYKDLNIANGMRNIIAKDNAAYVPNFLPNGMCTIAGVMGLVTGLAEANLYLTYLPETYKEPYATAIAPQMKKLGYSTDFWYGGPNSWEQIQDFVQAQGFDKFYGVGDFQPQSGNVWGSDDKYLYQAFTEHFNYEQPGFHVILNISNHSPYTVNLAEEGFDPSTVQGGLPEKSKDDGELLMKLGHHWYEDKMMSEFIEKMYSKYPDSIFIVVGDHADRVNIDTQPSMYERYGIPFIIYGKGINKNIFPKDVAGSHINVGATIMELIAPKNFEYYSIGESLTKGNKIGFNYALWMTNDYVGKIGLDSVESIPTNHDPVLPDPDKIQNEVDAMRAMSWWRVKYGKYLN